MAVGLSDGTGYDDEEQHLSATLNPALTRVYITGQKSDGDSVNTAPTTASTMPLQAPAEPAGALKSSEGSLTPASDTNTENIPNLPDIDDVPHHDWVESTVKGIYEAAKSGLSLPGDVAAGKIDPTSPQGIERAMDLAGLMVFGPAPVASKMADGTLGSFVGVKSKTFDRTRLYEAQNSELDKVHPDTIWNETGTFRGSDGRWRQEISDEGMSLKDKDWTYGEEGKLSDYVDHPELFKAYPELKNMGLKIADKDYPWLGGYNSESNTITLNPSKIKGGDQGILDVLAHEMQHKVQNIEGFDQGSNPIRAYSQALDAVIAKMEETGALSEERARLMMLYIQMQNSGLQKFGNYMYSRVPGEVEANLTMNSRLLTDEQRRAFTPADRQQMLNGRVSTTTGMTYQPEFQYPEQYKQVPFNTN
jgi:hypothetical protein